jgi:hypothetical protein
VADANGYGAFEYAPPTGFLALCSKNLSEPTVVPSENFNTKLYTGNATAGHAITGVGFAPDWTWIKSRGSSHHTLFDKVRGAGKALYTDYDHQEVTVSGHLTSFDSDGFTLGANVGNGNTNQNNQPFVSWNWKANGSGSSNTDGTITSTVSANVDAGFSIVGWTGNSVHSSTVGHGLASAPELTIVKCTNGAEHWLVQHKDLSSGSRYMRLNTTDAEANNNAYFPDFPTASAFEVGTSTGINYLNYTYIAYCFHSVEGYSRAGTWEGNHNADGTFIYMGFKPAWIMLKSMDTSYSSWLVTDNKLNPTNDGAMTNLWAESSSAENPNSYEYDFLSNGLKLRATSSNLNSSHSFLYIAFAEQPFKYANAR